MDELAAGAFVPADTLLDWCTDRMTYEPSGSTEADASGVWAAQEDTRLAVALRTILRMDPAPDLGPWIDRISGTAALAQPAPIPAAHSNTSRTLRALISDLARDPGHAAARRIIDKLAPLVALPS